MNAGDAAAAVAGARAELVAALVAGAPPAGWTVRPYAVGGPWEGRTVLIVTGTPYLERAPDVRLPDAYRLRLGALLVAGLFDVESAAAALDELAGYALAAVVNARTWEPPAVGTARSIDVAGGRYLTATLTVSRLLALC